MSDNVKSNEKTTQLGGVTGKGFMPGQSGNPYGRGLSLKTQMLQQFAESFKSESGSNALKAWVANFLEGMKIPDSWQAQYFAKNVVDVNLIEMLDQSLNRALKEDSDFLHYRLHQLCHDTQQQILLSKSRYKAKIAGRRAGKTESNAQEGVDIALETNNARLLYIGLTFTRAIELYWEPIHNLLASLGVAIKNESRVEGMIKTENGTEFHFHGNSTVTEREKLRGAKWHYVCIDEAQSHKALPILLEEIIEPSLMDYKGKLTLAGTGPKVRGTYWERIFTEDKRFKVWNWNIGQNPFIPDYDKVLEKVRIEKGWTEQNPTFLREYMGQLAYDDDALVFRLGDRNFYQDDELMQWCASQPVTDIRFTAGLDYGWTDSDGFAIIAYSTTRPERFLIWEHKQNRTGVTELADAMKQGLAYKDTLPAHEKHCYVFADTNEGKVSFELATMYGLPVQDAYKQQKDMAIELLQEEIKAGLFRVRKGKHFEDEAMKTVFMRNEQDNLTRKIDDDTYHPDLMDAILYAMRPVWMFERKGT